MSDINLSRECHLTASIVGPINVNASFVTTGVTGGGGSGLIWQEIISPVVIENGKGYVTNGLSAITLVMPNKSLELPGFRFALYHLGVNWVLQQNADQIIRIGGKRTTLGNTGYLSSNDPGNWVEVSYKPIIGWVVEIIHGNIGVF